jgi:hypothetical protein
VIHFGEGLTTNPGPENPGRGFVVAKMFELSNFGIIYRNAKTNTISAIEAIRYYNKY